MADKDLSLRDFLADALVFADVINLAFRRQHFVVKPNELRELDTVQIMTTPLKHPVPREGGGVKTTVYRQRVRDILKVITMEEDGKKKEILLGIEGQSKRSRFMPLRIWQYEDHAMSWAMKRCVARKKGMQPLPGMLDVVLYMLPGKWPGATRLSQLQQRPKGPIARRMNDVQMNVLTVEEISRYNMDSFYSDIGVVANAIVYADNPKKLWRKFGRSKKVGDLSPRTVGIINEYTNLGMEVQEIEEHVNMCNAKEFWMKEGEKKSEKKWVKKGEKIGVKAGREIGVKEGREIGKAEGIKIGEKNGIRQGIQKGIDAMIASLREMNIAFEEIVGHLQKQFQLSRREAVRQVKKAMA